MNISFAIDGVDYTPNLILPIKWNALLDERLDEGRVSLRNTSVSLFRIGAPVAITVENKTIDFIVSADESMEIPVGSGMYNHELSIIEPTKILEGIIVESLTFINNLGRTYNTIAPILVEGILTPESDNEWRITIKEPWIETPQSIGDVLEIHSYLGLDRPLGSNLPIVGEECSWHLYNPQGDIVAEPTNPYDAQTYTLKDVGQYKLSYTYVLKQFSGRKKTFKLDYEFVVSENYAPLRKWNIKTVINRVLNLCEPHLKNISQCFFLDDDQAKLFENIESPEFAFTNLTLKEILDQIGGFIHGIPRLIRSDNGELNTIYYDMLGGINDFALKHEHYVSQGLSQNITDYATQLDSSVDNLVNTLNADAGSIIDPYADGYKTLRAEQQYIRIGETSENQNGEIATTYPIYSIHKLEVFVDNQNFDITPYVYEINEYNRLSSYSGVYPTSKSYALYYQLGDKNIKGLWFKEKDVTSGVLKKYSISNIIDLVGKVSISDYSLLGFRVTYTPIFSDRIVIHKPFHEIGAYQCTRAYNQSANLVETKFYGENIKGLITRMGNAELWRTYYVNNLSKMPQIGQLFKYDNSDYYVSSVVTAIYVDHIELTVGFSKDFNRLSQYVGINSQWRAYEISERMAYNRDWVYTDYAVLCDGDIESDNLQLITKDGLDVFMRTFIPNEEAILPITSVVIACYDKFKNEYLSTLPVISTAFGNVLSFEFGMADNYSAGGQSVYVNETAISGYWQTDVQYTDYYGRIDTMSFWLRQQGYVDQDVALMLPEGDHGTGLPLIKTPNSNGAVIDKNGSEILRCNYELQFVTIDPNIIIGPALMYGNSLVGGAKADHNAAVYVLTERLSKFATHIDLLNAKLVKNYSNWYDINIVQNVAMGFGLFYSPIAGKSFAVADTKTGEIYFAKNIDIAERDKVNIPSIVFTHKLP